MWGSEGGGHLQVKNDSKLRREHGATYICVKIVFCFSCKYTHGVVHWLSWPHDTLPFVLILTKNDTGQQVYLFIQAEIHIWANFILGATFQGKKASVKPCQGKKAILLQKARRAVLGFFW